MARRHVPKKIGKRVNRYLHILEQQGVSVERAILFGSYARGNARPDSDIDVCIVSPSFRNIRDPLVFLWTHRSAEDRGIAPVGFAPEDFSDVDPLVWEIKQTGVPIVHRRAKHLKLDTKIAVE